MNRRIAKKIVHLIVERAAKLGVLADWSPWGKPAVEEAFRRWTRAELRGVSPDELVVAGFVLVGRVARSAPTRLAMPWLCGPRTIAATDVEGTRVTTYFLPMALWSQPFETVAFGPQGTGGTLRRYSTWDDARCGHEALVADVRAQAHGGSNAATQGTRALDDYLS